MDQVASQDTTALRTQQAIDGVTGQILPGGLGGVGSGFIAAETAYGASSVLYGAYGGLVDSSQAAYSAGAGIAARSGTGTSVGIEQVRAQRIAEMQAQAANPADVQLGWGELNVLVTGVGSRGEPGGNLSEIRALPPSMRDRLSDASVADTPGGAILGLAYSAAEMAGDAAALFSQYGLNPVTGEMRSPGQLQRTKEDLVINVGTLGVGAFESGAVTLARQQGQAMLRSAGESFGLQIGGMFERATPGLKMYVVPEGAVSADVVGVPVSRSPNPLSPVQEVDAFGNQLFYRTMSPEQFAILERTGQLPATTETSISPVLSYSSKYSGTTVKFTMAPGTSEQLQTIGIAANPPAAAQLPTLSTQTGPWMQTNVRFKVEGGQMTTQLGQGRGIDIFNQNMVQFDRLR